MKLLVLYYNGNDTCAKIIEIQGSSSLGPFNLKPEMIGLTGEHDTISAVIEIPDSERIMFFHLDMDGVTPVILSSQAGEDSVTLTAEPF